VAIGIVNTFDQTAGHGCITPTGGGEDLHVLATAVNTGSAGRIKQGVRVHYTPHEGAAGPSAQDVRLVVVSQCVALARLSDVPSSAPCRPPTASRPRESSSS
jgi:cold shock CspA family protein